MSRSKRISRKSSQNGIRRPTTAEIQEAVANLHLNQRSGEWLSSILPAFADHLIAAMARGDHDFTELRRTRLAFLKRLKKALVQLQAAVGEREDTIFEDLLAGEIGLLFSTRAFESVVPFQFGTESIREREAREYRDVRAGPYQSLESGVETERQFTATYSGRQVFTNVISRLISRVDEHLKNEANNTGGSPGLVSRNYVLRRLILIHNQLCEFDHSRSHDQFEILAEQVLPLLGLSTDGLEAAVRRLLKTVKSRNPTRR